MDACRGPHALYEVRVVSSEGDGEYHRRREEVVCFWWTIVWWYRWYPRGIVAVVPLLEAANCCRRLDVRWSDEEGD